VWYLQSLGSVICLAGMILIFTGLRERLTSPANILVFVYGFGFCFFFAQILITKERINLGSGSLGAFFAAAVLSYVGNLLYVQAVGRAPNPGYVAAIVGIQAVPITIASIWLFKSPFSWLKLAGVLLCVLGAVILLLPDPTNSTP
jgi:drug/metabolite transporter (DMT)-like permease